MSSKRLEIPLEKLLVTRRRLVGILPLSTLRPVVADRRHLKQSGLRLRRLYREHLSGWHHYPVGYTDDVFGYLPTEIMIQQGGYETDGFLKYFSYPVLVEGLSRSVGMP